MLYEIGEVVQLDGIFPFKSNFYPNKPKYGKIIFIDLFSAYSYKVTTKYGVLLCMENQIKKLTI
jgi:hypothetical protein